MPTYGALNNTNTAAQRTTAGLHSSFIMPEDGTLDSVSFYCRKQFTSNAAVRWFLYEGGISASDAAGATLVFDSGEQTITSQTAQFYTVAAAGQALTGGTRYWIVGTAGGTAGVGNLYEVASADAGDMVVGIYVDSTFGVATASPPATMGTSTLVNGSNTAKGFITYTPATGATITGDITHAHAVTAGAMTYTAATVSIVGTQANGRELRDENQALITSGTVSWEWYDKTTDTTGNPLDSGTFTPDANGEWSISPTGSTLLTGQSGTLILELGTKRGIYELSVVRS